LALVEVLRQLIVSAPTVRFDLSWPRIDAVIGLDLERDRGSEAVIVTKRDGALLQLRLKPSLRVALT